jgi:hypothetical protein
MDLARGGLRLLHRREGGLSVRGYGQDPKAEDMNHPSGGWPALVETALDQAFWCI